MRIGTALLVLLIAEPNTRVIAASLTDRPRVTEPTEFAMLPDRTPPAQLRTIAAQPAMLSASIGWQEKSLAITVSLDRS